MLNKTLIVAGATACLATAADAGIVTRWTFNGGTMAATNARGRLAKVVGGAVSSFTTGSTFDTSIGLNQSARANGFSASTSESGRRGFQFSASTAGFDFVSVSFVLSGDAQSSRWGQFQYSTDGGSTYLADGLDGGGRFRVASTGSFRRYSFDLGLIDGISDRSNFRFRIVAVKDPSNGRFVAANGGSVSGGAFWQLDRVFVSATPNQSNSTTPAPGAIALLAAAGMVSVTRRRA